MKNLKIEILVLCISIWPAFLQAADYEVGPGDVLSIKVFKEKDFTGNYKVDSEGNLNYSVIGELEVKGKTESEIEKHLKEILSKDYLVNPKISVFVKEYRSKKVMVLGGVNKPGIYYLKQKTHVLDMISQAGGMKKDGSARVVVLRKEKPVEKVAEDGGSKEIKKKADDTAKLKPIVVDYSKILSGGDLSQNIEIMGGDIVNIPKSTEIYVFGSVRKPGPVPYSDKMGVLQAITLAGGPAEEASQSSTYIIRMGKSGKEKKIKVNLSKVLKQKSKNISVKPNDVIVVPESFF